MKRLLCTVFLVSLFVAAMSCVVFSWQASALKFNVEIINLSPNMLSPTTLITHDSGFDLFDEDAAASAAVELPAETGDNSQVLLTNANGFITKPHPGILGVGGTTGLPLSFNWACDNVTQIKAIPASIPSPLFLLGTGLVGLAGFNNRRKSFKQ